jgi:hypothetical protein
MKKALITALLTLTFLTPASSLTHNDLLFVVCYGFKSDIEQYCDGINYDRCKEAIENYDRYDCDSALGDLALP